MIIFQKQHVSNISIAAWQITENEDYFWNFLQLFPEDEAHIRSIKLQKVRLQKLACRAALAELLGNNKIGISYSETGQPQLKGCHISFAHTEKSAAVALSDIPLGIDMEELTPRILPLYPKFMSSQEIASCDVNNLKDLYYFWCAKEAMYKWFTKKNLDFIEDLQIDINHKQGTIRKAHTLPLVDFFIDNRLIVVCG
jgi:phosphopantetheinyl transferase